MFVADGSTGLPWEWSIRSLAIGLGSLASLVLEVPGPLQHGPPAT